MVKDVNVFLEKIVFYCDEIDAEPNVQKKYYAIELMF
jgi:hypothetical protein